MSHKKKKFDNLEKGKFPRDKLRDAVRDVLNYVRTTYEASKEYKIAVRTIQENVKYAYFYVTFWILFFLVLHYSTMHTPNFCNCTLDEQGRNNSNTT